MNKIFNLYTGCEPTLQLKLYVIIIYLKNIYKSIKSYPFLFKVLLVSICIFNIEDIEHIKVSNRRCNFFKALRDFFFIIDYQNVCDFFYSEAEWFELMETYPTLEKFYNKRMESTLKIWNCAWDDFRWNVKTVERYIERK